MHLAQANIGRLKHPQDDPRMAGFVSALAHVNALADRAPGFVWRFQSEPGQLSYTAADDPTLALNLSVWTQWHPLFEFIYRSEHGRYLRRRSEWFVAMPGPPVLWWVPAGHEPTPAEAIAKIEELKQRGPTPAAFSLKHRFFADGTRDGA